MSDPIKARAYSPSAIDAVDLGIMWDRVIAITDEILLAIVRTAFSVGVREAWDLACVIFDTNGRSMAQATQSMPAFIGTAPATMMHMLQQFPPESWQPGDVVATNDPWLGTGHTPDLCLARPVFFQGHLVGFVMTISHLPDIGGAGLSVMNTSIYQEGLLLPIVKIVERGHWVGSLRSLIETNVRTPDLVFGDIEAGIAGCSRGERLLGEFLQEYGLSDLMELADGIIQQSEQAMRDAIRSIPDGVYRHQIDVETVDDTVRLMCAVRIEGDLLHVDFQGSGPCSSYAINVPLCYTRAFAAYAVKCLTTPRIPNNLGSLLALRVTAPEGCILNALKPAPTGGRHAVGWFIVPLIHGALASVIPHEVQAESGMASLFICQTGAAGGEAGSIQFFMAGGLGAMQGRDGAACTPSPTNNAVVPAEVWESETGVRLNYRRLLCDSGGAGEFRGGLGQEASLTNLRHEPVTLFLFGMRTRVPASGFLGGQPGALRVYELDGKPIPSKGRITLAPGQTLRIQEAGGGGYGDPRRRDPQRVLADVRAGAVSIEGAWRDYGVRIES
jgi:N-methylhydantoinase B